MQTQICGATPSLTAPAGQVRLSLLVVTCDRARDLHLLFSALERQTVNGALVWELVLVDNGSRDETAQTIREFAARASFSVIYVFEPQKGKSRGLNAGMTRVRGTIVALTDDDGIPAPDWLEKIDLHFSSEPQACVGGRVELHDAADALITVRTSTEAKLVTTSNFAVTNIPVIGCNLAIDAAALRRQGPFDSLFGPGSPVGSGDDLDMLYRILRAGDGIRYDPRLVVFHNHGRRSADSIDRVKTRYLAGRGGFYCKYILQGDPDVRRWAYWEVRGFLLKFVRGGFVSVQSSSAIRNVAWLLRGAIRYLRHRAPARKRAAVSLGRHDST